MIPGPWYSAPWWRKAWLWTRYALPCRLRIPYRMARWAWLWYVVYRTAPQERKGGWHDKLLPDGSHLPCIHLKWELTRYEDPHAMGRWWTWVPTEEV